MNHILTVLLVSLSVFPAAAPAASPAPAAADDLTEARSLLLSGHYAEAAEIYTRSASKDPVAALGLARTLEAEGKLREAVRALTPLAEERAELQAELARLAFQRGDYEAAEKHTEAAIRIDPDQLLARWIRGELLRTSGQLEEATEAYRWLVRYYNGQDVEEAEPLRWIGLGAARYARWNRLHDQFGFLVNELYPDALKAEPGYWPAHLEAGLLFVEKYNQRDAARELKAAAELNPHAAEVHAALALLALANRQVDQAQASLERALEINPNLLPAWLAKADLAWANFQPAEAIRLLEEHALPLNPVCEETLGRVAACYVLRDGLPEEGESTRFTHLVDEVTARNEHAGEFFFTLAAWLDERHKMPEAERFYREAIERMPQQLGPRSHLGLMTMHAGREEQAQKLLEQAFEVDPFNVRVKNTLEVLEVLDSMETLETGQLIVKFDGKHDRLLARYASRHLEAVYADLCTQFGYRPPQRPLVEIFNRAKGQSGHTWFSTRLTGLPYLGTVAASTGRIVAMVSPGDPSVSGKFNWARVLRHEMVHVVTLQQTEFNIPHWYTEALAVWSEGYPRPQSWNELLAGRVPEGKLFNLETINFGFTRPNSSDEWHLAYCQSELYVEYMLEDHGPEVLGELLAAYAENLTTPEAIRRVFGVSLEEFEQGYLEYLNRIAAGLSGLKPPAVETFADLLQAQRDDPDNADLAARVAYGYLRRGALQEALESARQALKLQANHQVATYVLARLQVRAGHAERAIELLAACLDEKDPEPRTLNLLAGLKLKAEDYAEAARLYELGARSDPHNLKWQRALARVYLVSENEEKLAEVLARLAADDPDDLTVRMKLARMALSGRDFAAAADWANQALQIDVTDAGVHRVLAEAWVAANNYPGAIEEYETAIELDPKEPQQRFALADAYLQAGKPGEARRVLEALLQLVPDYPGAELLLESVEEKEEP